jgi:hypothetical protein
LEALVLRRPNARLLAVEQKRASSFQTTIQMLEDEFDRIEQERRVCC